MSKCQDCGGSGIIEEDNGYDGQGNESGISYPCETCGGSGES